LVTVGQLGQLVDFCQGSQARVLLGQSLVQSRDALGGNQPQMQVVDVECLGQVIVGAGLHTLERVGPIAEGCQQDEVGVGARVGANQAAQLGAFDARHEPVADDDV